MMRSTFWFVLAGMSAMLAGPLTAAEPTAEDYIAWHMPFLGAWKATAEEDGKTYPGTIEWRLGPGGKCMLIAVELKGLPVVQFLHGYDPVSRTWVGTSIDAEGTYQLTSVTINGMARGKKIAVGPIGTWKETRFSADGKTIAAEETLSCEEMSAQRIVMLWSNRREQGKNLPDWKLTYERPSDAAPSASYEHLKFLECMVGEWRTEYELDGRKVEGDFTCQWSPGKYCLTWTAETRSKDGGQLLTHGSGVIAWDAATKQARETAAQSDGTLATAVFSLQDGKIVIDRSGTTGDGTHFTTRPVGTYSADRIEFGENTWVADDGKILQSFSAGRFLRKTPHQQ